MPAWAPLPPWLGSPVHPKYPILEMLMQQKSWLDHAVRLSSFIAILALIAMMLTSVADVFMAKLFSRPITGTYDLVETTLVFTVFLGIPATFLNNGNIVVDVVDFFASKDTIRRLKMLSLITSFIFLVLLAWNMLPQAQDAYRFGDKKPELGLPLYVLWIPMLAGICLSALAVVVAAWRKSNNPGEV